MEEVLTREQRLAKGDVLTSSALIEELEKSTAGGVSFARRLRADRIEYIHLKNPVRE